MDLALTLGWLIMFAAHSVGAAFCVDKRHYDGAVYCTLWALLSGAAYIVRIA